MDIRHLTGRINPGEFTPGKVNRPQPKSEQEGPSFAEVFKKASELEFSGHARKRLEDRSISMDESDVKRLEEAVTRAEDKGSQDSLILDGDRAFLVNIPNKTVVTAVDMMELRERVFTNIDSTVLTNRT